MGPDGTVIARDVADYRALSLAEAVIALRRHPFGLQAPEEPLHRGIIPAVTPATHALLYPTAPQSLPVLTAGIVAALIAVEHHACWLTPKLPGHLQCFDREGRVRRRRYRPAHRFAGEQIQHCCQISPAFSRPDIRHIAAPDLIRRGNRELPVEMVRYFNVFVPAAFEFMRRDLATGDIQLFHQLTGQPSPESDALSADHRGDTSRASRATTGVPDFTDETPFNGTLGVRIPAIFTNVAITASVNTEQPAQWRYRVVRPQTVYYRELFRESDIKSAVAFFRISFSISRRCIRFLISLSSVCSGVRGSPGGVFPWRSIRNDFTRRLMAERLTFIALAASP
ncbi:MAG: hypothetical protein XXXJIFNMEKO3_03135 [Candidatus Erwinia impunctatus]